MKTIDGYEIEYVLYDGPCALVMCAEPGPHAHPVCPVCGAVKFGNARCETCRKALDLHRLADSTVVSWKIENRK